MLQFVQKLESNQTLVDQCVEKGTLCLNFCPDRRDFISYLFPFEPMYFQNFEHD